MTNPELDMLIERTKLPMRVEYDGELFKVILDGCVALVTGHLFVARDFYVAVRERWMATEEYV